MSTRTLDELKVGDAHVVSIVDDEGAIEVWLDTEDGGRTGLIVGLSEDGDRAAALRDAATALHTAARKVDEQIVQLELLEGR